MKKLTLLAAAVFGLVVSAQAQAPFGLPIKALGFDSKLGHVVARLPLGADNLDVGFGLNINSAAPAGDNAVSLGLSGFYVKTLNTWGPVANNIAGGGWIALPPSGDFGLGLFAGFQPEITLLDRLILSTRFGLQADVLPDFVFGTIGDQISVVQSINFKIRF